MEELKAALTQSIYRCCQKVFPPFLSLRFDSLLGLTVNEQSCLSLQLDGLLGLPTDTISGFSRCTSYTQRLESEVAKAIISDCWKFIQDMRTLEVEGMISIILDNSEIIFLKLDHSSNKRTVLKPAFSTSQGQIAPQTYQSVTDFTDVLTPDMEVEPGRKSFKYDTKIESDMSEDDMTDVLEQAVLPEEDHYTTAKHISRNKFISNNEDLKTFVLVKADKGGISGQHPQTSGKTPRTPKRKTVHTLTTHQATNEHGEVKMLQTTIEQEIDCMSERKRHTHYQRINGKQICPICQRRFPLRGNMAAHIRTHTGVKPYICEQCPYKTITRSLLNRHISSCHSDTAKLECQVCGKKLRTEKLMKDHMNIHTGETPYECEMCGKSFSNKRALHCHEEALHFKKLRCKVCAHVLPNDEKLKEHENAHETGDIEEKFKIKAKRQARIRIRKRQNYLRKREMKRKLGLPSVTQSANVKKEPKTRRKKRLSAYVNQEEPSASFVCDECSETFNSASDLMNHLIGHKEENTPKNKM